MQVVEYLKSIRLDSDILRQVGHIPNGVSVASQLSPSHNKHDPRRTSSCTWNRCCSHSEQILVNGLRVRRSFQAQEREERSWQRSLLFSLGIHCGLSDSISELPLVDQDCASVTQVCLFPHPSSQHQSVEDSEMQKAVSAPQETPSNTGLSHCGPTQLPV